MKRCFTILTLLLNLSVQAEVAYQNANVRFTLISPSAIRLEWSATGQFTDRRSLLATERQYDSVPHTLIQKGKQIIIRTSEMEIAYRISKDSLTAANLSITSLSQSSIINHQSSINWQPGQKQVDNLKGTYRTLDRCSGDQWYVDGRRSERHVDLPLEDGLLARCGWTLINDSRNLLFDDDEISWWQQRVDTTAQDWYFLLYGNDYKKALKDFTRFAGAIPVPPTYAFGFWWSRYWAYSADDIRQLVANFNKSDIPLDVLVLDMDWHYSDGQRGGWTGYTWNRELFPDPEGLLRDLHKQGIHVTLNLHPADGITPVEERYAAFAKAMGDTSGDTIAWQSSNKRFMTTWTDSILRPLEKQGVDFWWLDWQQFPYDKAQPQLNNTWWLNYFVYTDAERHHQDAPMLYHRWGGLGNHRYQVGFSGDTYTTWESLQYQPYFNHTASNVLYGYWSHDLGGHMARVKGSKYDEELYLRWLQFGVFSPIMRVHSTKDASIEKEPWLLSTTAQRVIHDAIQLRYRLRPYIYRMALQAHETGVSLCRPLYYDYPLAEEAYQKDWRNEYMFGDDLLIAPITSPMVNGLSTLAIWLPEGEWIDLVTGDTLAGNQIITRSYTIYEYPVFAKSTFHFPLSTNYGVNAHPYDFLPTHDTPAPEGYTPFYISHYGRHGARADQGYKYYPYLISLLTQAQQDGMLTQAGDSLLKLTQEINLRYDDMPRRLLPLGQQQHAQLAERMIDRYPEVFDVDSPCVRAISSMVPRCLMSMAAFTNALTRKQNRIRYTMDCGERYQQYINCRGKLNLTEDDTPPLIDSLCSMLPKDYDASLRLLFRDAHYLPDSVQARLIWTVYSTLIYAPLFEIKSDPYMFLSQSTMRYLDARVHYHFYIDFGNSPYGRIRRPYAQLGLNDIIARADSAICHLSPIVADLRFGHDDPLLAMVCAMDLEGVGDVLPYSRILLDWSGEQYIPMAANVQLIFYKNEKERGREGEKKDILVKVLYNEQECRIHGLKAVNTYYYRWEDVRWKWLHTHRFATYNVRYVNRDPNKADKGNRSWASRRDYVISNVMDNHIDIIGMNEVTGNNRDSITGLSQLQDLQQGLKDYTCIAYEREDKNYSYNCIFYLTDKYECLHHESFWLSETPDVASKGWGSRFYRRCIVALMRDKRTHQQFYFCCTHTDFDPIEVGEHQAELLGERLTTRYTLPSTPYTPLVLVGDLNYDRYEKPSIQAIYSRYFQDSSDDHLTPTYNRWRTVNDTTSKGLEIDYLYYLNMIPRHRKVITEDYGRDVTPSDHFPVYVDFQLDVDPTYDPIK